MEDIYEILNGVPAPPSSKQKTGLTETLRKMKHGDRIVVPNSKKGSVYACAAQAGIKVRTQSNANGQDTTVWRIDESSEDLKRVTPSMMNSILTPDGELPTGHWIQPDPYGPRLWINDVDTQGRPVDITKKKDIFS